MRWWTLLLALATAAPAPGALAVGSEMLGESEDDFLDGTKEEQEVLRLLDKQKFIEAREKAQKILEEDKGSFIASWAMGVVYHEEEANHARALFLIRKAKDKLHKRYGMPPTDRRAIKWHKEIIKRLSYLLGEMDRRDEQLALLDEHDKYYKPPMDQSRIWMLMKMGRLDEGRALARKLTHSDDVHERVSGYNGLIAIESEALDREATWKVGLEGIERTQGRSCILAHNASSSALEVFEFEQAERLARQALKADIKDCSNPSWSRLAAVYLVTGKFGQAVSAIKSLREEPIDKRLRAQFEMGNRGFLVELLYAMGKFEEAERFMREIHAMPDRTGMTSSSKEVIQLGMAVGLWMLLDARIEQERERSSVRSFTDGFDNDVTLQELKLKRWEIAREVVQLAAHEELVVKATRPYLRAVMPWYSGSLIPILGSGVMTKAVESARKLDAKVEDKAAGYFEAMLGEIAWRDGDWKEAVAKGELALEKLPKQAALIRHRVMAWLGDAQDELGQRDKALALWHDVLKKYPTTLRHLQIAIPARIESDDSELGDELADRLEDSRRIELDERGFLVRTEGIGDDHVAVCLADNRGTTYACANSLPDRKEPEIKVPGAVEMPKIPVAPLDPAEREEQTVLLAADRFHDKVFAPKVELTQADINSLDGSAVRADADHVLKDILGSEDAKLGLP